MAADGKLTGWRPRTLSLVGVVAMTGVANLLTLVYQVFVGRDLGPAAYGLFSSIFVVIGVVGVAASGLQLAAAQSLAAGRGTGRPRMVDTFTRDALGLAAVLGALIVLVSPALSLIFRIGYEPFVVVAAYVPVAAALSIVSGRYQGQTRILAYTGFALALAVGKIVSMTPVPLLGLGSTAYLASFMAASAVVAAAGLHLSRSAGVLSGTVLTADVRRAVSTMTLFWFISNVDIVAARAFLPEEAAGQWAAASVLAKSALILPALISTAVLPLAIRRRASGGSSDHLARRALALALGVSLLPILLLVTLGPFVVEMLYGPAYDRSGRLAWQIALAIVPIALAQVLLQFHLARENGSGHLRTLVLVSALAPLALWWAAPSVHRFVVVVAVISLGTLLGLAPLTKWRLLLRWRLDGEEVRSSRGAEAAQQTAASSHDV